MTPGLPLIARFNIAYPGFNLPVDLSLPGHGITALFGHSGCGKTSFLRAVAGLERFPDSYLEVAGEVWQDDAKGIFVPVHRRAIGYVFQEASLFAHLSVRQNLAYGLKRSRRFSAGLAFEQVVDWLGIEALLDRRPERLSGGERQRIAIARALLSQPRLLLFDEPLSALDLKRKAEILPFLERLHSQLDIPMLYVSHSPDEVARLADYLVLLAGGKVLASGLLHETLARLDVAGVFADEAGVALDTVVAEHDEQDQLSRLDFNGGSIYVTRQAQPLGRKLRCRILARDVSLNLEHQQHSSILNIFSARVLDFTDSAMAGNILVRLDAGGTPLLAKITRRSLRHLGLTPGQTLWAQVKAVALLE